MKCLKPDIPVLGVLTSPGTWKPDSLRGNRHQRGYGTAWEKQRKRILDRDNGLCQPCMRSTGRVTMATEVDHVIPKARGGSDADANLQAICNPCHKAKTAKEASET